MAVDRECGECTVCCYVGAVPELNKPPHRSCRYQGKGCSIYDQKHRPNICNVFQCAWLRGLGKEGDSPDKSQVMITTNVLNGGTWVYVIELKEDAVLNEGMDIVLEAVDKADIPVIVVDFGSLPPDDYGDRALIKESLEKRASKICGEFITQLDEEVNMYRLLVN
jgi:hypothetical protein